MITKENRWPENIILEATLLNISDFEIHQYYQNLEKDGGSFVPDADCELKLIEKKSFIIDLSLAKFSSNTLILKTLFEKYTDNSNKEYNAIRLACISNINLSHSIPYIFCKKFSAYSRLSGNSEEIKEEPFFNWLLSSDSIYLKALFKNPKIDREFLTNFFGCDDVWDIFDEYQKGLAVWSTISNPIFNIKLNDRYFLEPGADYHYNLLFENIWSLSSKVEKTENWAICLYRLYKDNKLPFAYMKDTNFLLVSNKWLNCQNKIGNYDKNYFSVIEGLRVELLKNYVNSHNNSISKFLKSDDRALRLATYEICRLKRVEIKNAINVDGKFAIDSLFINEKIWSSKYSREILLAEIESCNLTGVYSEYYYFEKNYIKEHPEWFDEDECDEILYHDIKNVDIKYLKNTDFYISHNKLIRHLNYELRKIKNQNKKLINYIIFISIFLISFMIYILLNGKINF